MKKLLVTLAAALFPMAGAETSVTVDLTPVAVALSDGSQIESVVLTLHADVTWIHTEYDQEPWVHAGGQFVEPRAPRPW